MDSEAVVLQIVMSEPTPHLSDHASLAWRRLKPKNEHAQLNICVHSQGLRTLHTFRATVLGYVVQQDGDDRVCTAVIRRSVDSDAAIPEPA